MWSRLFYLFILLSLAVVPAIFAPVPEHEQKVIQKGLGAAADAARAMRTLSTFKTLAKIGSVLGPILTVATVAADIAMLVLGVESEEMILLRREFADLSDRLDRLSDGFTDVRRRIDWSAVQIAFARHEAAVRTLDRQRIRLTTLALEGASDSRRTSAQKRFLADFEADFSLAAERLFLAMSGGGGGATTFDLFNASAHYTIGHRRLVTEFAAGCIRLLLQAASVQLAYVHLRYNDSRAVAVLEATHRARLNVVGEKAQATLDAITNRWADQAKADVPVQIRAGMGLSHKEFATRLHAFLADKFDWRRWSVVSYDERSGYDEHAISACGGNFIFRTGGRCTVYASRGIDEPSMDEQWAWGTVDAIQYHTFSKDAARNVLRLVNYMESRPACYRTALIVVAQRHGDRQIAYATDGNSTAYQSAVLTYRCPDPKCWFRQQRVYNLVLWG